MNSSSLTSDQTRKLRRQIEPVREYLGKLIYRCRELGFPEHDPLLHDAIIAAMRLDHLDRSAMRAALKHGDDERALDMSERDVRRA